MSEIVSKLPSTFETALASGDLIYFPSGLHSHAEGGIEYQIRVCPALKRKPVEDADLAQGTKSVKDPFAPPYNPHLYVGELHDEELGGDYAVLLNKYSVIPHHFILATKENESQTSPLLPPDLVQTYQLLFATRKAGRHFIAFYNCGDHSGASQPHKHIQFIPIEDEDGPPVERLAKSATLETPDKPFSLTTLPYANHVIRFPSNFSSFSKSQLEQHVCQAFLCLVDLVISTIRYDPSYPAGKPSYNVIMTLDHMHMIPRRLDTYTLENTGQRVSVNSLGFAGHLLVKSEEELEAVKREGIAKILRGVALGSVHDLQVAGTSMEIPDSEES